MWTVSVGCQVDGQVDMAGLIGGLVGRKGFSRLLGFGDVGCGLYG